jgi:glycosyltransferase involved in cell wall biosynthesis
MQDGDECICIDDGSTNRNTIFALEQYCDLNPRFRLKRIANNLGIARALNIGLEMVANEYILRLDADDTNIQGRTQKQMSWFRDHHSDLCGTSMLASYGEGTCQPHTETLQADPQGDWVEMLRHFRPICFHPTWCIETRVLSNLGGYPTTYEHCEDFALQCQMLREGCTFTNCPEVLVNKRQHPNRISERYRSLQRENAKRALRDLLP